MQLKLPYGDITNEMTIKVIIKICKDCNRQENQLKDSITAPN